MYTYISVHSSVPYEVFSNLDFHSFINLHNLIEQELASRDLHTFQATAFAFGGGTEKERKDWQKEKFDIIFPDSEQTTPDASKDILRDLKGKVNVQWL